MPTWVPAETACMLSAQAHKPPGKVRERDDVCTYVCVCIVENQCDNCSQSIAIVGGSEGARVWYSTYWGPLRQAQSSISHNPNSINVPLVSLNTTLPIVQGRANWTSDACLKFDAASKPFIPSLIDHTTLPVVQSH
jgi:hypothetical protein